ncbi:prolyl oligopeptidase [Luteibacter rhizovicinus]|uniref:prolyl oligopeptidase n=1 Tax=Luteibacter rhizovicinus TaxID=242606 RepID=A0A4R3YYR1_9GAMM|nr:prolyl oligopeptidase family serine peptidase [Luteibacter rhizovicinus]TCV97018.1 prolyl oligopeptidase [Luteibacter rhizovicinus]
MHPHARRLLALALTIAVSAHAHDAGHPSVPPPGTQGNPQGGDAADPHQWLERADDPAVQRWIVEQNAHTEAVLGAISAGDALTARIKQLAISATTRSTPMLVGGTLFYLQQVPPQSQPVLIGQTWPAGAAQPVLDPNANDNASMAGYWPSPDGRYLAYGTEEGGDELTTLHVLDVKSGKALTDTLPWAGGGPTPPGLAWDADGKGFLYVRYVPPQPGASVQLFNASVVHHALGAPATADRIVFGEHYSPVAEYELISSNDVQPQTAILAYEGDGGPAEVFVRQGGTFRRVLGRDADVRKAVWVSDRLYVTAFKDAPRGKVVAIDGKGRATTVLEQREGAIQQVAPLGKGFLVVRSWGPDWWMEHYDAKASLVRRLPLPEQGIAIDAIAAGSGQDKALISYRGWVTPRRWVEYDGATGDIKTVFEVKPTADYSAIEVHRIDGVSKDGTKIPVTILAMKGVRPTGSNPTILEGYGGFGSPVRPGFVGAELAWLERGGVLAYANTRGGNEFGETWHAQGQKLHKQNVIDDFHAASLALLDSGWTDRAHLGIFGISDGGLLMGASLVQHPQDYRAVVARVGLYDIPRHEVLTANGRYNRNEYGSMSDPAQARATLAYSPLQHVKPNVAYPAVLLSTGANDSHVGPWQSRKFAAALQAAALTLPPASRRPTLLLTRMNAGHGAGAPFSQRVGDTVLSMTFFASELGLADKAQ